MNEDYWVYMLLCENNSYYTGYTNNIEKRYHEHLTGTGRCKYTQSFKPIMIAQCWHVKSSKSLAMQLEREIKQLPKLNKTSLITRPSGLSNDKRVKPVTKRKLAILNQI